MNNITSDSQENEKNKESNYQECKIYKKNKVFIEEACNRETLFTNCEQHSVNDNQISSVSEFNSKINGDKSSISNEQWESFVKLKMFQCNYNTQEIEQVTGSDIYFPKKKFQSWEKIPILDNSSLPYDTDFKKPNFLRYSVFEDNSAAFKDESSPNLLLTAASSLSSLTIDDDDYSDNIKPCKAGLVKTKLNLIDSPCEPSQIFKLIKTKQTFDNQSDKCLKNSLVNQEINKHKLNTYSCIDSYQTQKDHHKRITLTGHNVNNIKRSNLKLTCNQYNKNTQIICCEAEGSVQGSDSKNKVYVQNIERDKSNDIYKENKKLINCNKTELDFIKRYGRNSKHEEQEFSEQNKCFCEFYQCNNKINYSVDESNELNAYEEQLLDQCIRRGMAKVTKQNITDIKPFCWDLNQICLTTRAMLKTHDENITKEKPEEYIKRHILHQHLTRYN